MLFRSNGADGKEICEVIDVSWADPGTRLVLAGQDPALPAEDQIDADTFFSVPIHAAGGSVLVGAKPLQAGTRACTTVKVVDGDVG